MPPEEILSGSDFPSGVTVSQTDGRYLLAIHWLSIEESSRVATSELQERVGVSAASVTEMVDKLDDRGFVDHEKYRGVTLTEAGHANATRLAWRFCVVTNFFESVLETDVDDDTIYKIGFTLPGDGLSRLREFVDHPCIEECPESSPNYSGCLI